MVTSSKADEGIYDVFRTFSVSECANQLRVSNRYIYKLLKSRQLHGRRVGKSWRITPESIRAFLNSEAA